MLSLPLVEDEVLEFKRDWSSPQKAIQALAAFANTRGGTLVVGLEDDGVTVTGFDPDDAEVRRIVSSVVDLVRLTPEVNRVPAPNGRQVFTLTVRPSPTLVAVQGRYLIRVGATNRDMTPDEISRRTLEVTGQSWDSLASGENFRLDHSHAGIDPQALRSFLKLSKARLPSANEDDEPRRILENLRLVRDGQPNRAALLLFGRRPKDVSSGSGVQIAQFRDGLLLQDRTIEGNLVDQLSETLEALRVFLGVGYAIGNQALKLTDGFNSLSLLERIQRADQWPYPLTALREAVVNALIHREYASSDRTQIRIDEGSLTLWNPGGLPTGLSIEALSQPGHVSRRRNPHLADAFYLMGVVERWGTGTTRMIQAMQTDGLPAPTFSEEGGGFRVTFRQELFSPDRLAQLNARQRQAVASLRGQATITNAQYRELTGAPERTASLDLKTLVDLGFLRRQGQGRDVHYLLNTERNPQ